MAVNPQRAPNHHDEKETLVSEAVCALATNILQKNVQVGLTASPSKTHRHDNVGSCARNSRVAGADCDKGLLNKALGPVVRFSFESRSLSV